MSYFVQTLLVDDSIFERYITRNMGESNEYKVLDNLSKINIFVGSNNSGKSQFVRKVFGQMTRSNECFFIPRGMNIGEFNNLIADFKDEIGKSLNRQGIVDYEGISKVVNNVTLGDFFVTDSQNLGKLIDAIDRARNISPNGSISYRGYATFSPNSTREVMGSIKSVGNKYKNLLDELIAGKDTTYSFYGVYIPTLRGLRPFRENEDFYLERTNKDYFSSTGKEKSLIFTGLGMYENVKKLLLGNLDEREIIAQYQEFLGENFFDGEKVALIPAYTSDVLNVKIGNEQEQPIYNLGDGIQSIIIITFPLFLRRGQKAVFFIEEPELYMHPGLQRKLIEVLMKFEGYQYFITTHSNHFLDITLDIDHISVYSFRKKINSSGQGQSKEALPDFVVENVSNEDNSVLEMLGVKNSSVFLSNCTIWVEGITDRYYLKKYFDLYQKEKFEKGEIDTIFREDYHFSFVEYSGGNITHWSFLDDDADETEVYGSMNVDRICSRLFLITDKDSQKKLPRQQKLEDKLKERYYCLSCKEIENLIPDKVVKKIIARYEGVDVDQLEFSKEFSTATYKNKYLGEFIEETLLNKKRRGSYEAKSGTISDKLTFCKRAIDITESIEDLSTEAIKLCEKLYEFVRKNNS